jgi:hypothetical protein
MFPPHEEQPWEPPTPDEGPTAKAILLDTLLALLEKARGFEPFSQPRVEAMGTLGVLIGAQAMDPNAPLEERDEATKYTEAIVDDLLNMLVEPSDSKRQAAAAIWLGKIGEVIAAGRSEPNGIDLARIVDALCEALANPANKAPVRVRCAEALGRIGSVLLRTTGSTGPSSPVDRVTMSVQEIISSAGNLFGENDPKERSLLRIRLVLKHVANASKTPPSVRNACQKALGRTGGE